MTAKRVCEISYKGKLPLPLNAQEDKDFYAAIQDIGEKRGMSLKSAFLDGSDQVKEKDWRDSKNNKITYLNWAAKQPDNAHQKEHYLHIHSGMNGKWNDAQSNYFDYVICQKDPNGKLLFMTFFLIFKESLLNLQQHQLQLR